MTVGELIEKLMNYEPSCEVIIAKTDGTYIPVDNCESLDVFENLDTNSKTWGIGSYIDTNDYNFGEHDEPVISAVLLSK